MEKNIINCHTHAFNFTCVPDAFLSNYVQRIIAQIAAGLLRVRWLSRPVLFLVKALANNKTKKMIDFLLIGTSKSVEDVFTELRKGYQGIYPNARMVILTMNFDYMTQKGSSGLFETQLAMIKDLKRKYPDVCLPFLGIDPRMEEHGVELISYLHSYFNKTNYSGFVGLKLYPSLGFYPFNPQLEKVYSFAEEHSIPMMTHCTPDGAYYADSKVPESLQIPVSFNYLTQYSDLPDGVFEAIQELRQTIMHNLDKKPADFCDFFLHPLNYWDVLDKFPKLKICLAHCGGEETIVGGNKGTTAERWYQNVKEIVTRKAFANTYADVSFVLYRDDVIEAIRKDMDANPLLSQKLLFGTDFFMTTRYVKEFDLVENFRKKIGETYWHQLAIVNPRKYLTSDFFNAQLI
ncbi:amidohydrolase family protein [Emticicia sp. BO119]|uniref:amidohydrolase family protein n=1 Tax=Emticicia sp. BO119 TaxID=2757768 RepID=UPI0015F0C7DA|nr:amidohydrolase family protein [Emticicia sp. BO119]MBA4853256.1 amidohydrolase family protein [Emticicia sp. BO119]